jgi:hypothetical protein
MSSTSSGRSRTSTPTSSSIVGVHSPKFVHEADHEAVLAAVERYDVRHPVLDDPDLTTWSAYAVRAWPTLALVDPEGYVVAQFSGEGHAHGLDALLAELVAEHDRKGTLAPRRRPVRGRRNRSRATLRFPAKVIELPDGHLLVADAGHHSLAELEPDGETLVRRIGNGRRGLVDGPSEVARFNEPNGLCLLPPDGAAALGYDVVVADTVNHCLRGVTSRAATSAPSPAPASSGCRAVGPPANEAPRGGPVVALGRGVVAEPESCVHVAMAGIHQLWELRPVRGDDPCRPRGRPTRGCATGRPTRPGSPSRPGWRSGRPTTATASERLWVVDSETSSLRTVRAGVVATQVGQGLFDFGHRDGPAEDALFQHPLGVTLLPDGSVAVLDTYNDAVRRYDPVSREVSTLATGLREPSGAVLVGDAPGGRPDLLVVESAAHRLTRLRLPDEAVRVDGGGVPRQA